MHHADQEIFQIAVDRWKRITDSVETYEKHINEHLRDVIKELNDNPKLKTLWIIKNWLNQLSRVMKSETKGI